MKSNLLFLSMAVLLLLTGSCAPKATSAIDANKTPNNEMSLLDGSWKLVSLNGQPVSTAESSRTPLLTLQLNQQRVTGHTGCNRLMGGATFTPTQISFKALATTRMACLGESLEQPFIGALSESTLAYEVTATQLILRKENQPLLVFTRTEAE